MAKSSRQTMPDWQNKHCTRKPAVQQFDVIFFIKKKTPPTASVDANANYPFSHLSKNYKCDFWSKNWFRTKRLWQFRMWATRSHASFISADRKAAVKVKRWDRLASSLPWKLPYDWISLDTRHLWSKPLKIAKITQVEPCYASSNLRGNFKQTWRPVFNECEREFNPFFAKSSFWTEVGWDYRTKMRPFGHLTTCTSV